MGANPTTSISHINEKEERKRRKKKKYDALPLTTNLTTSFA
jgi:hypothetical protein